MAKEIDFAARTVAQIMDDARAVLRKHPYKYCFNHAFELAEQVDDKLAKLYFVALMNAVHMMHMETDAGKNSEC